MELLEYVCNLRSPKVETEQSEAQGNPQWRSELEANLSPSDHVAKQMIVIWRRSIVRFPQN